MANSIIVDVDLIPDPDNASVNELMSFIRSLREAKEYDSAKLSRAIYMLERTYDKSSDEDLRPKTVTLMITENCAALLKDHYDKTGENTSAFVRRMIQERIRTGMPGKADEVIADNSAKKRISVSIPSGDADLLRKNKLATGESASAFIRRMISTYLTM